MVPMTGKGPNAHMTLSMAGEKYIKAAEEEGGKPKLKAYNDGTGTWTIGWGCTKGVTEGMRITVQQAQEMLDTELAGHIGEVHRLIKRPISQGLFDILVSFFFNHGCGNCPTLLKAVNGGNDTEIRKALMLYVYAYDEKKKQKVVWAGLVNRRTSELQHWAKMDAMDAKLPTQDTLATGRAPKSVAPPNPGLTRTAVSSTHVRMSVTGLGTLVVGFFTDVGKWVAETAGQIFEAAPQVTSEVSTVVSTSQQWGGWLGLHGAKYVIPLVLSAGIMATIRYVVNKNEGTTT
jgi:lysozyme